MKKLINSILFYVLFFLVTLLLTPFLFLSLFLIKDKNLSRITAKAWTKITLIIIKHTVGLTFETEGFNKIRNSKTPVIIASKHQSMLETGLFVLELGECSTFIIKKELKKIPLFGRMISQMGAIAIDRKKPVQAIRKMLSDSKTVVETDRDHIIIFPEGRRTAVGEKADYTEGLYLLYKDLNIPVAAVAVNSGLFWPKHGFIKYPGTAKAKVVDIIPVGLDRDAFRERVITSIENGSYDLLQGHHKVSSR